MADIVIGIDVVGEEKLSRLENQIEDVSLATNTLSSNMGQVGSSAALMSGAADQSGNTMNNFGYKANFASMQLQDMAVQLQGGQDAMVVFSQQGSQLSQLLPGLAGAISGIALVVGTGLVRALIAANSEMKSFADVATEVGGTLDGLIESTEAFTDSIEENTEAVQSRRLRQMQESLEASEEGIQDLIASSSRDLLRSAEIERVARAGSGIGLGGAFGFMLPEQFQRDALGESRRMEKEARDAAAALAELFTAVDLNNMESLNDAVVEGERFLEDFGDATKLTDEQIQALNDTIEKFIERYEQLQELGSLATPGSGGAIDALFSGGGGFGGGPGVGQGYSVAIDHETGEVSRTVFDLTQSFGGMTGGGMGGSARGGIQGASQINYMADSSEQMVDILAVIRQEEEAIAQLVRERGRATVEAANVGVEGNKSLLESNLEIAASIQETIDEEERLAEAREQAQQAGQAMSRTIVGGLKDVIFGTKDAGDAFRDMALSIIEQLMDIMIFQPLMNNLTTGLAGAMGGGMGGGGGLFGGLFGAANGAAFSGGNVVPFANGGVVTGPALFGMSGNQTGLMGEAGPEAILPLTRGANGKLGVEASGQGVVIHQHFSFTANGDESVKKIIAAEAPKIAKYTEAEIIKSRHKGGAMKRAFG